MIKALTMMMTGIIFPVTVPVPESTLVPPQEILEVYQEEQAVAESGEQVPSSDLPAYLIIPSIGVTAAVHPVGLTDKGAVDVPQDPARLGWFDKGPVPGQPGSAIIDGHRGWRNKTPAVFDRLHEIQMEDLVIVVDDLGNTSAYQVYDIKTYDPHESPEEVFAISDKSLLNLITCNGEWDAEAKTATKRLVVFTQLISP